LRDTFPECDKNDNDILKIQEIDHIISNSSNRRSENENEDDSHPYDQQDKNDDISNIQGIDHLVRDSSDRSSESDHEGDSHSYDLYQNLVNDDKNDSGDAVPETDDPLYQQLNDDNQNLSITSQLFIDGNQNLVNDDKNDREEAVLVTGDPLHLSSSQQLNGNENLVDDKNYSDSIEIRDLSCSSSNLQLNANINDKSDRRDPIEEIRGLSFPSSNQQLNDSNIGQIWINKALSFEDLSIKEIDFRNAAGEQEEMSEFSSKNKETPDPILTETMELKNHFIENNSTSAPISKDVSPKDSTLFSPLDINIYSEIDNLPSQKEDLHSPSPSLPLLSSPPSKLKPPNSPNFSTRISSAISPSILHNTKGFTYSPDLIQPYKSILSPTLPSPTPPYSSHNPSRLIPSSSSPNIRSTRSSHQLEDERSAAAFGLDAYAVSHLLLYMYIYVCIYMYIYIYVYIYTCIYIYTFIFSKYLVFI
jgi:hypothetical protein